MRAVQELPMTEKQLQEAIAELAQITGWLCYHTYDSRRSNPGFPDFVLVRPGRVIFAELKSSKGRITPNQAQWLGTLQFAPGVEVYLWRPEDWSNSTIQETLTRKEKR